MCYNFKVFFKAVGYICSGGDNRIIRVDAFVTDAPISTLLWQFINCSYSSGVISTIFPFSTNQAFTIWGSEGVILDANTEGLPVTVPGIIQNIMARLNKFLYIAPFGRSSLQYGNAKTK